jgi:hypothetical protein
MASDNAESYLLKQMMMVLYQFVILKMREHFL